MKFTESHEWIEIQEGIGTIGITDYAQKELGEIVYVELPPLGKELTMGEEAAVLESTKAAADLYAPISGKVIAINEQVKSSTNLINASAEMQGWLFKIKISQPKELDLLLSQDEYVAMTSSPS